MVSLTFGTVNHYLLDACLLVSFGQTLIFFNPYFINFQCITF